MYSSITIVGRLGRDPEMKYTPSGQAVTSFSVATDRQYKDKNGEIHKVTTWHRIATWGKQAEICNQYLKKGSLVLVTGELNPDKETGGPKAWTDKEGNAKAAYDVTASTVRFLSRAEGSERNQESDQEMQKAEDEFPF